jgi:hypothetical protein
MKLELDLTAMDYLRAISLRRLFLHRLLPFALVLATILVGMSVFFAIRGSWPMERLEHRLLSFTLPWFAICFGSYVAWVAVHTIWNCFTAVRRYPELYQKVEVEFDDQAFKIANRNAMAHWTWPEMFGYDERRNVLVVRPNKHTNFIIPKRALSAPHGVAFDQILRQKLKKLD